MNNSSVKLVYIIDDEVTLADSLAMIFEIKGWSVKIFDTAEEAINQINEGKIPALIVIDGNLPGMNGDEAIATIRATGHEGMIVGVSAADFEESMTAAGVSSYWPKPFELADFVQQVV